MQIYWIHVAIPSDDNDNDNNNQKSHTLHKSAYGHKRIFLDPTRYIISKTKHLKQGVHNWISNL